MRIIVIDDNHDVLEALVAILQAAGHEVGHATSAARAIEMQSSRPAEVVITDIFMPEVDGLEAIAALRARWPAVKIVAISGGGDRIRGGHYLDTARHAGADAVLSKPFEPQVLLDLLAGMATPAGRT